jgi:Transglycosylase SLT domain
MQNLSTRTLLLLNLGVMAIIGTIALLSFNGKGNTSAGGTISPEQAVRSINLNKEFTLCGEPLPMDNFDVKQRLDAELLRNIYFHSSTILAVKRANALFPIIEPILKQEGVHDDLKYLAVAESGLTNAISPAGARGVWQFMKSAADQYGMEVNAEVDERYDLEKATCAACKYLRHQRERPPLAPYLQTPRSPKVFHLAKNQRASSSKVSDFRCLSASVHSCQNPFARDDPKAYPPDFIPYRVKQCVLPAHLRWEALRTIV